MGKTAQPTTDREPGRQRDRARTTRDDLAFTERTGASLGELDVLAGLLDSRWRIPGTPFRFGIDAIIGLVPVLGDAASGILSLYLISHARELKAGKIVLTKMIGNVVLDTLVGSIPILGSVFDIYFKANVRNVRLLRRHLNQQ